MVEAAFTGSIGTPESRHCPGLRPSLNGELLWRIGRPQGHDEPATHFELLNQRAGHAQVRLSRSLCRKDRIPAIPDNRRRP
jgi:hypothetical protein